MRTSLRRITRPWLGGAKTPHDKRLKRRNQLVENFPCCYRGGVAVVGGLWSPTRWDHLTGRRHGTRKGHRALVQGQSPRNYLSKMSTSHSTCGTHNSTLDAVAGQHASESHLSLASRTCAPPRKCFNTPRGGHARSPNQQHDGDWQASFERNVRSECLSLRQLHGRTSKGRNLSGPPDGEAP